MRWSLSIVVACLSILVLALPAQAARSALPAVGPLEPTDGSAKALDGATLDAIEAALLQTSKERCYTPQFGYGSISVHPEDKDKFVPLLPYSPLTGPMRTGPGAPFGEWWGLWLVYDQNICQGGLDLDHVMESLGDGLPSELTA